MKVREDLDNTYECEKDEEITILFDLNPKNVAPIVEQWDGESAKDVDVDTGIAKTFDNSNMRVRLTFGFIKQGTCFVDIAGSNQVVETKEVSGDELTEIELFFIPEKKK